MHNNTTPRTDAEIEDWVNGLNHMADDHLCCRATVLDTAELIKELRSERNQLRKAADALAFSLERMNTTGIWNKNDDAALELFRELTHVQERNKTI